MSDINSLNLTGEPLEGFSADAELYQPIAPPPDGTYLATLEQQTQYQSDEKWMEREDSEGKKYFIANIIGHLVDPTGAFDKRMVFGKFVTTKVFDSGSSTVAQIVKSLGFTDELQECRTHEALQSVFETAVGSGRTLRVVIQWGLKWNSDIPKEQMLELQKQYNSMKKFPQNAKGEYIPQIVVEYEDNAGETATATIEARAYMVRYLPVGNEGASSGASA